MVTAKDVAKLANVSISTVSRVLNGKSTISKETREKVLDAAQQLGFQPNRLAQALITGRSSSIGLLVPELSDPIFAEIALGIEERARENNYTVILCNTDDRIEREHAYLNMLLAHRADGVVIVSGAASNRYINKSDILEEFRKSGSSVFLVNREPREGFTSVMVNYERAMYNAATHLLKQGKRKIAYLLGAPHLWNSKQKLAGYRRALSEWGVDFDPRLMTISGFYKELGTKAFADILDSGIKVDGLLCENDLVGIGVLEEMKKRGMKSPDDIAIVGFGNTYLCEIVEPTLSSVGYNGRELGRGVGSLMISSLANASEAAPVTMSYETKLVVRATSCITGGGEIEKA